VHGCWILIPEPASRDWALGFNGFLKQANRAYRRSCRLRTSVNVLEMLCNARVPGKYLGLGDKLQALPMAVMIVIHKLQSANWSSRGRLVDSTVLLPSPSIAARWQRHQVLCPTPRQWYKYPNSEARCWRWDNSVNTLHLHGGVLAIARDVPLLPLRCYLSYSDWIFSTCLARMGMECSKAPAFVDTLRQLPACQGGFHGQTGRVLVLRSISVGHVSLLAMDRNNNWSEVTTARHQAISASKPTGAHTRFY